MGTAQAQLATRIRELAERVGINQTELAQRSGLNRSYVNELWNAAARSFPKHTTLRKLAAALRATIPELTGDASLAEPTLYEANPGYRDLIDLLETREPSARGEAIALFRRMVEHLPPAAESGEVLEFIPRMEADAGAFQIREVGPGYMAGWPDESEFIVGDFDFPRPLHAIVVPQAAELAAGPPREPDDTSLIPTAQILHSLKEVRDERVRVIKVFGHSMHPLLQDGWKVLLDTTRQGWKQGDVVAAYIRNVGSSIGIFHRENEHFALLKHNPDFDPVPLPAGEWYPIGVVTTIVEAPVRVG